MKEKKTMKWSMRMPISELEVALDGNEDVNTSDTDTSIFDVEMFILTLNPTLAQLLVLKSLGYKNKDVQKQMKLHSSSSVTRLMIKLKKAHDAFFL